MSIRSLTRPAGDDLRNLLSGDDVSALALSRLLFLGLLEVRKSGLRVGDSVVAQVRGRGEIVATLSLVRLRLELVDLPAEVGHLVTAVLLGLVCSPERSETVFDVGDGLACSLEPVLRGLVLLPLEGVDLDFEFELATFELVDLLGRSFARDANTGACFIDCRPELVTQSETSAM
jgi:hypothetical protein